MEGAVHFMSLLISIMSSVKVFLQNRSDVNIEVGLSVWSLLTH